MAFKRSAVRSRLSPPKTFEIFGFRRFFLYSLNFFYHFLIHKKCIRKGNCTSKYAKLNSSGNTTDIKNTMNIMRHKVLDGKMSMHKNSQLSIMFFQYHYVFYVRLVGFFIDFHSILMYNFTCVQKTILVLYLCSSLFFLCLIFYDHQKIQSRTRSES